MKKMEKILRKYSTWEKTTQEEYESAKAEMTEKEFEFWYAIGETDNKPYKKVLPEKDDLLYCMLDEIHENTKSIKIWIALLGVLAVVGVIISIISAVSVYNAMDSFSSLRYLL